MATPQAELDNVSGRLINHVSNDRDSLINQLKTLGELLSTAPEGVLVSAREQVIKKWATEVATELLNQTTLRDASRN